MKVSRVSEMRELDRSAVEKYGIVEDLLMENAGQAAYFVLLKKVGIFNKKFIIFCGVGNNGGDGLVVARKIHSNGGLVKIFIIGNPEKYKSAAKTNYDIISRLPIEVIHLKTTEEKIKIEVAHCDAVVDAIFGTGLVRNIKGIYYDVIDIVNKSGKYVVSLDIPSGVCGDTAKILGHAIKADYTISFGLPKIGNMLYPGYELCGNLYVSHISFPPQMYNADSIKVEINEPIQFPQRRIDAHKGDFGKALFIAGASSYFGAPYFSALSFLKAGGGYSRLAAPASIVPYIANKGSEIVFIPQEETPSGSICLENKKALLGLSNKMDMVVIGPGLSLDKNTQQLVRELALGIQKPLLIDGDGITAVSQNVQIIKNRRAETILTPHLGEMSSIVKISTDEIEKDKINILQETSKKLNAIIVLKGAHSLIGCKDERVFINLSGNAGMATAGSGDVLTGTIAAMYGLGLSIEDAVKMGVFIHGLSGDLAARDIGEDGVTAQDILDYLPFAMTMYRDGLDDDLKERYKGAEII